MNISSDEAQTNPLAPTSPVAKDQPREKFIPVSRLALMDRLAQTEQLSLQENEQASCKNLFRYLSVWRHQTYQKRLTRLKQCYLPFSPDRDTKRVQDHSSKQLLEYKDGLMVEINILLQQANFEPISEDKLDELLQANSAHGLELKVDLGEFDDVLLYARGLETETIEKRVIDNLYLFKKTFKVPTYKRLFLLLKLKSIDQRIAEIMESDKVSKAKARRINKKQRHGLPDDPNGEYIYLRLFKDIPQEDLEMMFPNTQVQLRLFDKIKLGVTAGGGTVAGIAGAAGKIAAAFAAANPIGLAAAVLGVIGVIFRQVMSVFNTRTKYMMRLAQRLFFHSLANNRGVLTLMVDRAEEEDIKEEILLYFFLLRHPMQDKDVYQGGKLDELIEQFLGNEFDISVDFDIEDAFSRLNKDHLLMRGEDNLIYARPPAQACVILERKWRKLMGSDDVVAGEDEFEAKV